MQTNDDKPFCNPSNLRLDSWDVSASWSEMLRHTSVTLKYSNRLHPCCMCLDLDSCFAPFNMHTLMKPRVTLHAVGALSCQFEALNMWQALRTTKPPHFNQANKTHVRKGRHKLRSTQTAMHSVLQSCAATQDVYKWRETRCQTRIVTLSKMRHLRNSQHQMFLPYGTFIYWTMPIIGWIHIIFLHFVQYITRGVHFPFSTLPPLPLKLLLLPLLLQDWCFLFIKHQADIPQIPN